MDLKFLGSQNKTFEKESFFVSLCKDKDEAKLIAIRKHTFQLSWFKRQTPESVPISDQKQG